MGQSYSLKRRHRNKLINRDNLSRYRRQNGMIEEIRSLKIEATVHSYLTLFQHTIQIVLKYEFIEDQLFWMKILNPMHLGAIMLSNQLMGIIYSLSQIFTLICKFF